VIIIYYFVRFKKIVKPFVTPSIIISLFGISAIWLFNGGINGANIMPAFVILILGLVVVPAKTRKYIFFLFLALNILLLLIQFYRPDLIIGFPSETERWLDNLITLIYSSFLFLIIIRFIHTNYTQERLRSEESEKKYRLVVETVGEGIGLVSADEEFLIVNPASERIFGVASGELLGKKLRDLLSPEQYAMILNQTSLRKAGQSSRYEFELTRPDGIKRNIDITAVPQFDDNEKFIGTHGIFRDITETKLSDLALIESEKKLVQLNADKDLFISILGHDLKSPFNSILGLSEILAVESHSLDKDEIGEIAGQINKSARSTFNLLEEILMWARLQQGKVPFKPQKLIFTDICENVHDQFNLAAREKKISLICSIQANLTVFADFDMVKGVMRNLVSNAIKFTNPGGSVNLSSKQSDSIVTISVSDNGVGIDPESLSKLFDITTGLSTSGTAEETGTGLGLLLCKEFVIKHGGRIWCESEVGKGSIFNFTLPLFNSGDL
jgi:two-component system sensor histidine kinase/response regulator